MGTVNESCESSGVRFADSVASESSHMLHDHLVGVGQLGAPLQAAAGGVGGVLRRT